MKRRTPQILLAFLALLAQLIMAAAMPTAAVTPGEPPIIDQVLQNNPKLRSVLVDIGISSASSDSMRIFLPTIAGGDTLGIDAASRKPALWPEARGYHRMFYSDATKRVLLAGGEAYAGWGESLPGYGGIWSFRDNQHDWTKLHESNPIALDWATYDKAHDVIIAYVAFYPPATPDGFPSLVSETWAYHVTAGIWENRNPPTHPPVGLLGGGSQMAYDDKAQKVIMFGGLDLVVFKQLLDTGDLSLLPLVETNNTWVYDYDSNQWFNRMPANPPSARNSHALVYEPTTEQSILFGGGDFFESFDDTWSYNYANNTWSKLTTTNQPSSRSYGYMAYDERSAQIVYFGGVDYTETQIYGDTWLYDPLVNTWTEQTPTLAPSPRGWHDLVYSPKAKGIMLFGGGKDRYSFDDETWTYQVKSNQWVQIVKS